MNFDDGYILNLAIKISDIDMIKKYSKKVKLTANTENELYKNIYKYCFDKNIFKIFTQSKITFEKNQSLFQKHLLNMLKNPYDNYEMIAEFLSNFKNYNLNFFEEQQDNSTTSKSDSIITCLMKMDNQSNKKVKLMNLFLSNKVYTESKYSELLNSEAKCKTQNLFEKQKSCVLQENSSEDLLKITDYNLDLNFKNSKGLVNSKILADEDPMLMETLFLEKLENLSKQKNEENFYLYEKNNYLYFSPVEKCDINKLKELKFYKKKFVAATNNEKYKNEIIKFNLERFVNEPRESEKINFNDLEFKILLLNLKLRSMFDVCSASLSNDNLEEFFNKQHVNLLDNFMFEHILLEKI